MVYPGGIAGSNLLLQQSQLTLLNLNFTHAGSLHLPCRPSLSLLVLKRLKRPPCILDPLLRSTQLLHSHSHTRPARRRSTRHRPARLIRVPAEHDTPHTDVMSANMTAWAEAV